MVTSLSEDNEKGPGSLPGLRNVLGGRCLLHRALLDEGAILPVDFHDDAVDVAGLVEVERATGTLVVDVGTGCDQLLGLLPLAGKDLLAGGGSDFTERGREAVTVRRAVLLNGEREEEARVIGLRHVGAVGS